MPAQARAVLPARLRCQDTRPWLTTGPLAGRRGARSSCASSGCAAGARARRGCTRCTTGTRTETSSAPQGRVNNGNLTGRGSETFTYTPDNMMATSQTTNGTTAYAYDPDQWRAKRTTATATTYFLRGLHGELVTEWTVPTSGNAAARDYIYADGRLLSAVSKPLTPPASNDAYGTIVPNGPNVTATLNTPGRRLLLQFSGIAGHRYRAQAWVSQSRDR